MDKKEGAWECQGQRLARQQLARSSLSRARRSVVGVSGCEMGGLGAAFDQAMASKWLRGPERGTRSCTSMVCGASLYRSPEDRDELDV